MDVGLVGFNMVMMNLVIVLFVDDFNVVECSKSYNMLDIVVSMWYYVSDNVDVVFGVL